MVETLGVGGGELGEVAAALGGRSSQSDAAGLVQHDGELRVVELEPAPVDVDHLGRGVDAHALLVDDGAVHADPSGGDQRLAGAAGAEAGAGEDLLQPLAVLAVDLSLSPSAAGRRPYRRRAAGPAGAG